MIGTIRRLAESPIGTRDQDIIPPIVVTPRTLFFLWGQSNAEQHAFVSGLTDQSIAQPYSNVQEVSKIAQTYGDDPPNWQEATLQALGPTLFDPLDRNPPVGTPSMGLELTLMRDLDRARPGKFHLARTAIGGAPSTVFEPAGTYPTQPPGGPNYFNISMSYLLAAAAQMSCTQVVVGYNQGEGDSRTSALANGYAAYLLRLYDAMASAIAAGGVTFLGLVIGRVNAAIDPTRFPYVSTVRAAQAGLVNLRPNVIMVDQDPVAINPADDVHYTADGYAQLGHLWSPGAAQLAGTRVPPLAQFTSDVIALSASFTDVSTSPGDTVTSWLWDFGDGTTSTLQNPAHTYATTGNYDVTLTVRNVAGDTNATTVTVKVVGGYAGVSRDASSLVYCPRSSAQWTSFLSAISLAVQPPDALWLCQELSGHIIEQISGGLDLIETNNPTSTFRTPVAGWDRYAISQTDASAKGFSSTSSLLPDISTTSMFTMAFVKMPSSAASASRGILTCGTTSNRCADVLLSSGNLQAWSTNFNTSNGGNHIDGAVHPIGVKVDRTNLVARGYTDKSKMTPTFGAGMTGKLLAIGAFPGSLGAAATGYMYIASWFGAKAEAFTDAVVKSLYQGLGWTVPWT